MIDRIEEYAPQWAIAVLVIVIGVLVFIYRNPLHTVCDTQKNSYIKSQKKFLAMRSYDNFFQSCLQSNSAGGCEPYFRGFKTVLSSFSVVDDECQVEVANLGRVRSAMQSFLIQVPRLAWGSEGPESLHRKTSWLRPDHIKLFCRVQNQYKRLYGVGSFKSLRKRVLKTLPHGNHLKKKELQERSLFGVSCSLYF